MKYDSKYHCYNEDFEVDNQDIYVTFIPKLEITRTEKDVEDIVNFFNTLDVDSIVNKAKLYAANELSGDMSYSFDETDLSISGIEVDYDLIVTIWFSCSRLGHHSVVVDYYDGNFVSCSVEG
jgi:hypothetical protein